MLKPMVLEKNIIKKMLVEVETSSLTEAYYFKNNLDVFFRDEIYPEIDVLFQGLESDIKGNILRFDKVPLEINVSNKDSLPEIKSLLIRKLKDVILSNKIHGSSIQKKTLKTKENEVNAVIYFLEKGIYPWWFSSDKLKDPDLLNRVINDSLFTAKLQAILRSENTQKRLVYQLNDQEIGKVVLALSKSTKTVKITSFNSVISTAIRMDFWTLIFNQLSRPNYRIYSTELTALIKQISNVSDSKSKGFEIDKDIVFQRIIPFIELCNKLTNVPVVFENSITNSINLIPSKGKSLADTLNHNLEIINKIESTAIVFNQKTELVKMEILERSEPIKTPEVLEEGLIVQNAGLALLHPFLKPFFENLGFLSEEKTIIKDRIPEVLTSLYFLATKQESPSEHELLCEKFLCNIPFEEAVLPVKKLSLIQKEACEEMLSAALSHWPALKTKNIDALRSEFLMREGKITVNPEREKLFIQRKTQDILLEQLPWSLGIMKFPWKRNIVFLEW